MAKVTNIYDYLTSVSTKIYRKGEIVFKEGDISNGKMYFVFEGELEVLKKRTTGTEVIGTLAAGSFFGEIALIKAKPRMATIQAKSAVAKLGIIDKESFLRLSKSSPGFLFVLLKSVIERLTYAEERIEKLELEKLELSQPKIRSIDVRS
jgi:CRP-like cAMP-binding protein